MPRSSGICVRALDANGAQRATAQTDAGGNYALADLAGGDYRVQFDTCGNAPDHLSEYYDDKPTLAAADALTVTAGADRTAIDAQLALGARITGTVTSAGPLPLNKVCVQALDAAGVPAGFSTQTDLLGDYAITGLVAGSYHVRFDGGCAGDFAGEYYDDSPGLAGATAVTVSTGAEHAGVDALLSAGGHIVGTVTGAPGSVPLEGACVTALTADGGFLGSAATDAEGQYAIIALSTGDVRLQFAACTAGGYLGEYHDDASTLASATAVAVTAGAQTAIDAVLQLGGRIFGSVTGEGSPQPGMCVDLLDGGEDPVASATTDAAGRYVLENLRAGSYRVRFSDCGAGQFFSEYYDNAVTLASAGTVDVAAGADRTDVDADLTTGGRIRGTVTNALGQGTAGICVTATDFDGSTLAGATTQANGDYTIQSLESGAYRVRFAVCGGVGLNLLEEWYLNKDTLAASTPVNVSRDGDTANIDAQMATGGRIRGTVTAAAGSAPLAGVCVDALTATGDEVGSTTTASDGSYEIARLRSAGYRVQFVACGAANDYVGEFYDDQPTLAGATPIAVTAGEDRSGIDAALTAGARIGGHLTGAGGAGPLAGACVVVSDATGETVGTAETDPAGAYLVTRLPAGSMRVRFESCSSGSFVAEYFSDKQTLSEATPVLLTTGQHVGGVDAELAVGGRITGRVTDATGTPLANACVSIVGAASGTGGLPDGNTSTQTDDDGDYTLSALATGLHKVRFQACSAGNFVEEYYDDKPTAATADPVAVAAGQDTSNVDASLTAGGSIEGHVTRAAGGAAVEGVCVSAYDAAGIDLARVETDAAGAYVIDLPAGAYKILFDPCAQTDLAREYYDDELSLAGAALVAVGSGQDTTGIDAALAAGGAIRGHVTGAEHVPLAHICIDAFDAAGVVVREARSSATGAYRFAAIATGSYRLRFSPCGDQNYLTEFYGNRTTLASADAVAVTAGQTAEPIDVQLDVGGRILGRVTNAGGVALAGICADIFDGGGNQIRAAVTDAAGDYVVSLLRDSFDRVRFSDCSGHVYVTEFYDNKATLAEATPVAVTIATDRRVDAALATPTSATEPPGGGTGPIAGPVALAAPAPAAVARPTRAQIESSLLGLLRVSGAASRIRPILRRGFTASFSARVPGQARVQWFRVTRSKRVLIAQGSSRVAAPGPAKVKLKLTKAGRTLLMATKKQVKLLAIATETADGQRYTRQRTIVLRR